MILKAEVTFPGELKEEALICNICKQFNIILKIVEASFSTDTGWAILTVEGSNEELKNTFEYLKNKGVKFENIHEIA